MNEQNLYRNLEEKLVFQSLEGNVLALLADGRKGAWLGNSENEYFWVQDCILDFDLLKNYFWIQNAILDGKSFTLSFKEHLFVVELSYRERIGGYKEPLNEVIFATSSGHSLKKALISLNTKLYKKDAMFQNEVIDLEEYKLKRKRV